MNKTRNSYLKTNAQQLRKNMTKEERHLWYDFLKNLPVTFHRQRVIGNYIVDFQCANPKIIIELDGSQHYEQKAEELDGRRDAYLCALGYIVKRYTNTEINKQFESVCDDILRLLL